MSEEGKLRFALLEQSRPWTASYVAELRENFDGVYALHQKDADRRGARDDLGLEGKAWDDLIGSGLLCGGFDLYVFRDTMAVRLIQDLDTPLRRGTSVVVSVADAGAKSTSFVGPYVESELTIFHKEALATCSKSSLVKLSDEDFANQLAGILDRRGFSTCLVFLAQETLKEKDVGEWLNMNWELKLPENIWLLRNAIRSLGRSRAISPKEGGSLLLDLSYVGKAYNGCIEYGLRLYDELRNPSLREKFGRFQVLGDRENLAFHGVSLEDLEPLSSKDVFDICLRPYQFESTRDWIRIASKARRIVFTQHDVIGCRCTYIYSPKTRFAQASTLRASDGVIYISDYSRKDIEDLFSLQSKSVREKVIRHGVNLRCEESRRHTVSDSRTVLVVGNEKYDHKMLSETIDVLRSSRISGIEFIVLGQVSDQSGVRCIGNKLSHRELEELFESVSAFIYPSVYEGFGLPVLHAMRLGKPILVYDNEVNREIVNKIGGRGLVFFEGFEGLSDGVKNLVEKIDIATENKESLRTWSEVAQDTLEFVDSVCSTTHHDVELRDALVDSLLLGMPSISSSAESSTEKRRPQASIILTSYNYEEFVTEAIQSVAKQSFQDFELIVVDDGSSDGSVEKIRESLIDFPRHHELIVQKNAGQASAFNQAIGFCRGEYVFFLDSDDLWHEEKLERMVAFMRSNPEGGVYQHSMDRGSVGVPVSLVTGDVASRWKDLGRINVAFQRGMISPFMPTSGLSFRKEVLDRIFPLPQELITCPDGFLTRTASCFGPLLSLPKVLGRWREHGENAGLDNRFGSERFWVPVLMPAINRFYRENGIGIELYHDPEDMFVGDENEQGKYESALRASISSLGLQDGDRVLILRTAVAQHVLRAISELILQYKELKVDLLAQVGFELPEELRDIVTVMHMKPGSICIESIATDVQHQLARGGYRLAIVPTSNSDGGGYENVFDMLPAICEAPTWRLGIDGRTSLFGLSSQSLVQKLVKWVDERRVLLWETGNSKAKGLIADSLKKSGARSVVIGDMVTGLGFEESDVIVRYYESGLIASDEFWTAIKGRGVPLLEIDSSGRVSEVVKDCISEELS
ncbi:glycosyl transferase, group 2 family protein [Verrucomicrobiia bacterium DG1235]|nr:glycosyl transferase, group 2 family protein [Verrucomicrobiae bacterium DG1235]